MNIFNQNLKSPLEVKVEWVRNTSTPPLTLSISALMLNKDDVINKLEDFVFYGTPNNGSDIISADKSVTCDILNFDKGFGTESSYKMNLDLGKVSEAIDRINIVVSINTKGDDIQLPAFDSLIKATFSIKDGNGLSFKTELNKNKESLCRCIQVGLVKRYEGSWRFEEELEFKLGGLELVYNDYMNESIINNFPFSTIGDLCVLEKRYKETTKTTNISKDGSKSIIEKTVEMISTQLGKIADAIEPQKPWKGLIPTSSNPGANSTSVNSEKSMSTKGQKKWSAHIPQQHVNENVDKENEKSAPPHSVHKPWRDQIPYSPIESRTSDGASKQLDDNKNPLGKNRKKQIVSQSDVSQNKKNNKPWRNIIPNNK